MLFHSRTDYGLRRGRASRPGSERESRASLVRVILCVAAAHPALSGGLPACLAQSPPQKVFVIFPEKDVYREAADALAESLRARGRAVEVIAIAGSDADAQRRAIERCKAERPALIASGGTALTSDVLRDTSGLRVAFFMVPNSTDAPFLHEPGPNRQRVAGVPSDVSAAEQIEWVKKTRPGVRRIGVFHSECTRRTAEALAAAGKARDVQVELLTARADRITEATDAATRAGVDGVLMIPDAQVYNGANIQHLLVWGVREKRAIWAFSDKAVKAGALAGVFTEPGDVGRQCAEVVDEILKGKAAVDVGSKPCAKVRRAVNEHTAALIGVALDDARRDKDVQVFGDKP